MAPLCRALSAAVVRRRGASAAASGASRPVVSALSLITRIVPRASASLNCAFRIFGSCESSGLASGFPLDAARVARSDCIDVRDDRRRIDDASDETVDAKSVTTASSCANDLVERSASFRRSALNFDPAVIAAHHDKLAAAKFNNVSAHSDALMWINLCATCTQRVDNTPFPPSRAPLPPAITSCNSKNAQRSVDN